MSRLPKSRRLAVAALAGVASVALTACGASSNAPQIKTVADTALTKADFASAVSSGASMAKSVHMHLTSSFMTGDADLAYGPPMSMQMTMAVTAQGQTMNMQMRMLNDTIYMQIPGETPAGKFLSVNLSDLPGGVAYQQILSQYENLGPQSIADEFKKGLQSLKNDGVTEIDGQQVRHYTATINPAAVAAALGNNTEAQQIAGQLSTITEEIYMAPGDQIRRVDMALPAPIGPLQLDFTNWGAPVNVVAPPASDTVPVSPSDLANGTS